MSLNDVDPRYPVGRFTHFLYSGQQQTDEHGNDRDHYQELNQCESATAWADRRSNHKKPPNLATRYGTPNSV